jgi:hypothetical protein
MYKQSKKITSIKQSLTLPVPLLDAEQAPEIAEIVNALPSLSAANLATILMLVRADSEDGGK